VPKDVQRQIDDSIASGSLKDKTKLWQTLGISKETFNKLPHTEK
jgi:predicted metal-dependent peptidase